MKTIRAMVLVSSDPKAWKGRRQVYEAACKKRFNQFNLEDEISLSTMVAISAGMMSVPLVIVYPEAPFMARCTPEDVPFLVEEHLYKGRIAG